MRRNQNAARAFPWSAAMPLRRRGRAGWSLFRHGIDSSDLKWPLVSLLLVAVTAAVALSLLVRLFELAS